MKTIKAFCVPYIDFSSLEKEWNEIGKENEKR